jgi:CubicO group peptidase (beta-lactamase class C family)
VGAVEEEGDVARRPRGLRIAGVCGAVALVLQCSRAFAGSPHAAAIDAILAPWSGKVPGVVAIVVDHGKVSFAQGYGMADVAAGLPLAGETPLPLDSLTKQLTGAAVILLERRGSLGYDDRLDKYLPEIHAPGVTLRKLLRHESGLPDLAQDMHGVVTLERVVRAFAAADLSRIATDAPYRYNNSGYALLAAVIERISQRRFADFVRAELLDRAGMSHTYVAHSSHRAAGLARTYRGGQPFQAPVEEQPPGGGGVVTTAADMAKWYAALDRGLLAGYEREIESLAGGKVDAQAPSYAAGWIIGRSGDIERWSHGGSWRGSKNYVLRYPEKKLTIALFANSFEFGAHRHSIAYRIAELYLPALRRRGRKVATVSDACVTYALKQTRSGPVVIDGADDITAWRANGRWMRDPWPYGSGLAASPMTPC